MNDDGKRAPSGSVAPLANSSPCLGCSPLRISAGGGDAARNAPKWRTDFPIEWEGDHYVTRREMVKFLTLGSVVLALANWITAGVSRLLRRGVRGERYIGSAAQLEREGSLLFRYPTDQDPCIAVRTASGALVAFSQVCTHLSCAVVYDSKEKDLFCPCHNGRFSLDGGRPIAGPPTRPLPKVKIEQRGDRMFATEISIPTNRSLSGAPDTTPTNRSSSGTPDTTPTNRSSSGTPDLEGA